MNKLLLVIACLHAVLVDLLPPCTTIGILLYFASLFASSCGGDALGILVGVFGMAIMGLCFLLVSHVIYWLWLIAFRQQRTSATMRSACF